MAIWCLCMGLNFFECKGCKEEIVREDGDFVGECTSGNRRHLADGDKFIQGRPFVRKHYLMTF